MHRDVYITEELISGLNGSGLAANEPLLPRRSSRRSSQLMGNRLSQMGNRPSQMGQRPSQFGRRATQSRLMNGSRLQNEKSRRGSYATRARPPPLQDDMDYDDQQHSFDDFDDDMEPQQPFPQHLR